MWSRNYIAINFLRARLIALILLSGTNSWAANNPSVEEVNIGASSLQSRENPQPNAVKSNSNALRRLDFRIQGKSCAVCLLGVQRRLKELSGTIKTAVLLKKPYGASVIYDANLVTREKLIDNAKLNEPLIKLLDINDRPVESVPLILIPPHGEEEPSLQNSAPAGTFSDH